MNSPFLPEPETAPAATDGAKRAPWKTLLLWVLLIVMFLGVWQLLTPAEKPAERHASRDAVAELAPCPPSSSWPSVIAFLVPTAVFLFLLSRYNRAHRVNANFYVTQEAGTNLLARGRYAEAAAAFRETLPAFAGMPTARAVVMCNVGSARLHEGKLDEALAAYAEVERAGAFPFASNVRAQVAGQVAFIDALKGDVAAAKTWAADLRRRLAKSAEERRFQAASLSLAEATILCREGAYADAVKYLDERWLDIRFSMQAHGFRVVEVLRAFAEARGTGVRGTNVVAERLVRIEPVRRGELAFLGVAWPEMQTFLDAHDL